MGKKNAVKSDGKLFSRRCQGSGVSVYGGEGEDPTENGGVEGGGVAS